MTDTYTTYRLKPLNEEQIEIIKDKVQAEGQFDWPQLKFWQSGEWQVVQERLDDFEKDGKLFNPRRELLFAALDATPFPKVKVVICGQDPYPDWFMASGVAFSIPNGTIPKGQQLPPTLDTIYEEYCSDLHYPRPGGTSLMAWADRGVLLWNAIPTCATGKSLSHDWPEWHELTREIVERLSDAHDIVFVFMGQIAQRFTKYVDEKHNTVLRTCHPSPRAHLFSHAPFLGSRIFSTINSKLVQDHRKDPVDWSLEEVKLVLANGTKKNSIIP